MKKLSKIFLFLLLFAVITTGCGQKKIEEPKKPEINPLFYKITKGTDTTIYLLGSIHAADDEIYPLNNTIMNAFNESDYLAVELDIIESDKDEQLQLQLAEKMMYTDGRTIKDDLGEELYDQLIALLRQKKSYLSLYEYYKPVFFESLLSSLVIDDANMDSSKGVDLHFLTLAKQNNKKILEVESAEFQTDILLNFPSELYQIMIGSYVLDYDKNIEELKSLYEIWKKGNVEEIEKAFLTENEIDLTEEEQEIYGDLLKLYNDTLVINRNHGMADTLDQYMKDGKNVFCTVGLAHVVGEEGIVKLLEDKGYTIERLNGTF